MRIESIRWPLFGASAIAGIDLATKLVVLSTQSQFTVISGFFAIGLASNTGAAFRIFRQFPRMLTVLGILFLAVMMGYFCQRGMGASRREYAGVALVVGGAISNLIDRFRLGSVVDYLNVFAVGYPGPTFNLADSSIAIGIACLALESIRGGGPRRPE